MRAPIRANPDAEPVRLDEVRSKRHRLGTWRFLRFLGADPALADDLTQESFVQLLSVPFADRGDLALASWLRRTAQNLYRAQHRALRRELETLVPEQIERIFGELTRADHTADLHLQQLELCLAELDDRSRRVLELRHGEQIERVEIAELLGVSVEGVKSLLRRATERLRLCLRRRLEENR